MLPAWVASHIAEFGSICDVLFLNVTDLNGLQVPKTAKTQVTICPACIEIWRQNINIV